MSQEPSRAEHGKMDRRASEASEFFTVTHPELIPFVSDEATWYDFEYLEAGELTEIVQSHYGVALTETLLALPFWKLLDFLNGNRTNAIG
ncbi:MAG: hypothetical protein AB7I30_18535 [Isosphaeraceae bacterium]|jgi:hypothetical protein